MVRAGDLVAGRFRLLGEAGKGGTATVFRAFDMRENTQVALKLFESDGDQIKAEIWSREVNALQKLHHPAIVKLVDFGRCAEIGQRYIAVEWIEGQTLEEKLVKAGARSLDRFLGDIGNELLSALCHAFEQDVAHRDVSLRNILIDGQGRVRIIDFGQAKLTSVGIGKTVAGWKTPPYSPPEEDTGRYSYTRDPYAWAAVAVRVCSGVVINNHDELYDALAQLAIEPAARFVLEKALQRDPKQRFENILALREALKQQEGAQPSEPPLVLWLRILPSAYKWLSEHEREDAEHLAKLESQLVDELNEAAAVRLRPEGTSRGRNRVQIETASHRVLVDVESVHEDHLVVIGVSIKRFSLDGLYKGDAWVPPNATFRLVGANHARLRADARDAIARFYEEVESHLLRETLQQRGDTFLGEWSRVLDAMRELESDRVPALRYVLVEAAGRRLVVEVENVGDAREEQVRTISLPGSPNWVFKGELESIAGKRCTFYSKWGDVQQDDIPTRGLLAHDWTQTRKALDRQATAIKRFQDRETPSDALRRLLLREHPGKSEPTFGTVKRFYNRNINDEKKTLVSQFLGNDDLLLIHGPPGTGKTTLIVELIQQELNRNPTAKILLVSQTHVALDNVLANVAGPTSKVSAVRIVSGTKGLSPSVQHCSVDARGKQLEADVEAASRAFLAAEAARARVDYTEVELGLRASEALRIRISYAAAQERTEKLKRDIAVAKQDLETATQGGTSTTRRDEGRAKLRGLEAQLDKVEEEIASHRGQLQVAQDSLKALGKQGVALSSLTDDELAEWCDLLLAGPERDRLRKLMQIAEDWRLNFATSDDFKAAIIANSRIVAGTCVGFCREAAASQAEYDLCIVDEASKATTTELLLPMSRCKRAVLVGDHHQLPPFVEHALKSETLQQKFNLSPGLLEAQLFESLQKDLAIGQKGRLRFQHRMRGAIGRLVGQCFYSGELEADLDPNEAQPFADLGLAGLPRRVMWYDAPAAERQGVIERRVGTTYANLPEIQAIVDLLERIAFVLLGKGKAGKLPTIGVISGYSQQVEMLSREIARNPKLSRLDIESNTVHTFQGREVDICIYSVTRNNDQGDIGFLEDWRHLNVALSRARWHLVVVGSWPFCASVRGENPFSGVQRFIGTDADSAIKAIP